MVHAAVLSTAALLGSQAGAAVIFDGGLPDQRNAFYADTRFSNGTASAAKFVLTADASTVKDAHWWGTCASTDGCAPGNFTLSFYADAGGTPGELIEQRIVGDAGQVATGSLIASSSSFREYAYSAAFEPIDLTAGTTYWFAISNSPAFGGFWAWETTAELSGPFVQFQVATGWVLSSSSDSRGLAFYLTDDPVTRVPEPATAALFGFALAGLVFARRWAGNPDRGDACASVCKLDDPATLLVAMRHVAQAQGIACHGAAAQRATAQRGRNSLICP